MTTAFTLFRDIEASLLKFCNDIIVEQSWTTDTQPFNFDTHASINALPTDQNLLGIAELAITNDQSTYDITCSIACATMGTDAYLVKLREVMDVVFGKLKPGNNVTVVNHETGAVLGRLTVQRGVSVLPVAVTQGRPLQVIAVRFASSLLVPP